MSTEPKKGSSDVDEQKHANAEPTRENPAEQFEKARAKAEDASAPIMYDPGLGEPAVTNDLDRRLDLGYGGIFSGERELAPAPTISAHTADPAPSPLHGTYAGELVRRIRAALEEFEQHVASDARMAAGEVHDYIADAVNELRGHFHRE